MNADLTPEVPVHLTECWDIVTFRLDQRIYALPLGPIVQIIEMVAYTPLPQAHDIVEGVVNVRGKMVPLINLRRHFALPEAPLELDTPIILLRIDGRMIGLVVDEVTDVVAVSRGQTVRPEDLLPEELGRLPLLLGVLQTQDGPVMLLDPEHLFEPDEARILVRAAKNLLEAAAQDREGPSVDLPEEPRSELGDGKGADVHAPDSATQPARRRRRKSQRRKSAPDETPANTNEEGGLA